MISVAIESFAAADGEAIAPVTDGQSILLPLSADQRCYDASLVMDAPATVICVIRSPRPLRIWIDGVLVLDEGLFWRSFQRQVFAAFVIPLTATRAHMRFDFGARPQHPAFVDQACSSPNRQATLAAVAARYPDAVSMQFTAAALADGGGSVRFLPQQHVADDMLWQHVLVRPLASFDAPPSTAFASPGERPVPTLELATGLGKGRRAVRADEAAHDYARYHIPVAAEADLPAPLRKVGLPDLRPEPVQEHSGTTSLTVDFGDACVTLDMPVFEPLGRIAPRRAHRRLDWPDAAALRAAAPTPVLPPALSGLGKLYDAAWDMLAAVTTEAAADSGLPNGFMTTGAAFVRWQFVWDTAFSTFASRYAHRAFPVHASLDVLYSRQFDGGYIHRQHDVHDGSPALFEPDFSPNPPLLSTAELNIARLTGDVARLYRVYPVLVDHHRWLTANRRNDDGTFWTSGLASGCDNAPSLAQGYPDITAQMAQDADSLSKIASLIDRPDEARAWAQCHDAIGTALNGLLWNPDRKFYCGRQRDGSHNHDLLVSGFWPMWAGVAPSDRAAHLCAHLENPETFGRPFPVPSLAADSAQFRAEGRYWLGAVWPPTNYAVISGLIRAGYHDVAQRLALAHIRQMETVWLATGKIWENYSSEAAVPGQPAGPDFIWSALGPISLLLEVVIGLQPDAVANTLTWRIPHGNGIGVRNYPLGDVTLSLCSREKGGVRWIEVECDAAFTLVTTGDSETVTSIRAGITRLTPWGGTVPSVFG
jgi:hypothetical protein